MGDAMSHRDGMKVLRLAQPCARSFERGLRIVDFIRSIGLVDQRSAVGPSRTQPGPYADAVHLALEQTVELRPLRRKHLKLDAGRARVDDEDRVHAQAAGNAATARRAWA